MMNYRKSFLALAALIVVVLIAAGCPKPTTELRQAEDAISQAKNAGAPEYASNDYAAAEKALQEGKDLEKQGRYKEAREKYLEAARLAEQSQERAVAEKAERDRAALVKPAPVAPTPAAPAPVKPAPAPVKSGGPNSHTVAKGECLWWIAEYEDVYNDPFQWPLIYWANEDEIDKTAHKYGHHSREEDWIYPGQVFAIPRDVSMDKIKAARKKAGAPAPYTPPGM